MGVFLSKPDTLKTHESGHNAVLSYWGCSMRGWRVTMEDTSVVDLEYALNTSLFCIFDGHGGDEVARFCENNFAKTLKSHPAFAKGHYKKALRESFLQMDELMREPAGLRELASYRVKTEQRTGTGRVYSGCTAIVALLVGRRLFVANAGDCRALLFKRGGQVVQLNREHKPADPEELARIVRAGGVVLNGRIDEILNLSRALGDLEYKNNFLFEADEQIISGLPDVVEKELEEDDVGLLLGCDGVYEKLNDFVIRDIVLDRFEEPGQSEKVLGELFDQTLAPALNASFAGYDNMTGLLVKFDR